METKLLIPKIFEEIKRVPRDPQAYEDLMAVCREIGADDFETAHKTSALLRSAVIYGMQEKKNLDRLFEVYRNTLLFDAPYDLDSYLLFLEIDRKPDERFYQPRRKIMKQLVDALQELTDDKLDELFLSMPPRVGKLLADDTPVLTTNGWKNHGDLKVGDMVFAPDGIPVPVIGVLPKHHTTHTVTFSDGSKIDCHFRHEWRVFDRRFGKHRIIETQEMIGHLDNSKTKGNNRGHRYHFMVDCTEPICGVPVDLKVEPYTLGVWLGDGSNIQPRITGVDEEIFRSVSDDGYEERHRYKHKTTGVYTVEFGGLRKGLNKYGMCMKERTEKHIPQDYLIAPIEKRLELLAGLLDTDGCLVRKENRYQFTTSDIKLKESFVELVRTFGWRTSVKEELPKRSSIGIVGKKKYWVVAFNPTLYIPCRLERKQLSSFSKQRRLSIVSIEPSEEKQGNCITVFGGMYLAGKSMIPTHNTSILMFYTTWLLGKNPESTNLYSAYSDIITSAFYSGVLEILKDPVTYHWKQVFPDAEIVSTNASEETIDINRRKRYKTLTCRSLSGTLNGAVDCNGIVMSDDLIGSIEEALNPARLVSAWGKVDNNLIPRAKESAKLLWCGTRWSLIDPAGLRMDLIKNDDSYKNWRWKAINLPALDENDESNFDYDYGVGFSTEHYRKRRASFERNNDMASWDAQFMGQPIEREGAVFNPGDFRYYNGELPEGEPDRVFVAVDPAFGGGDFCSAPVAFQYGEDLYIHDVIYSDEDKRTTQPLIVNAAERYNVGAIQFETTKSTESYKTEVDNMLREKGLRINITSKPAPPIKSKSERIFDKAPDIREHCIFRESGKRSKEYSMFMQNVFSFKMFAKKQHDDAPDSLAQLMDMILRPKQTAHVFKRFF